MSMIKCSECESIISSKAHTCPKCGKPRTSIFASIILGIAITLLAMVIIMFAAAINPIAAGIIIAFIVLLSLVMLIIFLARRI